MSTADDLPDLLKRAGDVAAAAHSLAGRFSDDARAREPFGQIDVTAWEKHRADIDNLIELIASLREIAMQPTLGVGGVVKQLNQLEDVVQKIRGVMTAPAGQSVGEYVDYHVDLRTAGRNVWEAITKAKQSSDSAHSDSNERDELSLESPNMHTQSESKEPEVSSVDSTERRQTAMEQISFDHKAIAANVREFVRLIRQFCPLEGGPKVETGTCDSFNRDCGAYGALMDCWAELQRLMNPDWEGREFMLSSDAHLVAYSRTEEESAVLSTVWMALCRRELTFAGTTIDTRKRNWKPGRLPEVDPNVLASLESAAYHLENLGHSQLSAETRSETGSNNNKREFVELGTEIIARIQEADRREWWKDVAQLSLRLEEIRRRIQHPKNKCTLAAFIVVEFSHDFPSAGIAAEVLSAVHNEVGGWSSGCLMITSDPLAVQLSQTVLWLHSKVRNEHVAAKSGSADVAVRVLRRWIRAMSMPGNRGDASGPATPSVYVTIEESAQISHTPKKTLYHWKAAGKLPAPDVPHSGRRAAKWIWSNLRPELEDLTGMKLPECPPRESS